MRMRLSAYIAIQLVPSRLVDVPAGGQLRAAVEHADVVEAEESALEDVAALGVLAIHPPGEVQHQLVEHALEELAGRRLPPCCLRSIWYTRHVAQACTGGFTSPKAHS